MMLVPDFSMPATDVFSLRASGEKVRVFQVDITNHCNAVCSYCPHPDHERAKGFMSLDTFDVVLDVVENESFHLHHFTEPLLHKRLPDFIRMATERGKRVGFSTNGKLLTQEKLDAYLDLGLAWLRLHVNPFGVRLSEFDIPDGFLATEHWVPGEDGKPDDAPEKELVSYAGHVEGLVEKDGSSRCSYLGYPDGKPWRVVLWDGSFGLCCVDIEGGGKVDCGKCRGFVFQGPEDWGNYDG